MAAVDNGAVYAYERKRIKGRVPLFFRPAVGLINTVTLLAIVNSSSLSIPQEYIAQFLPR